MVPDALYRQVAALHAASLDQGFLSTLGEPFLALLYRAIDEARGGVLLVEERNGDVVGFVAGSVGMGEIYRRLLRRPFALSAAMIPSVARPARLRRIVDVLRYGQSDGHHAALPRAELLSIAVAPEARGHGVADSLYGRLVEHFQRQGIGEFRIVVGDTLEAAHRFYRRMGAEPRGRIELHAGQSSVVYVHRSMNAESTADVG